MSLWVSHSLLAFLACMAFLVPLAGCQRSAKVIAEVDGQAISMEEFREAQGRHPGLPDDEVFRQLLMRTALLRRARQMGLRVSQAEIAAAIKADGGEDADRRGGSSEELAAWEESLIMDRLISSEIAPHVKVSEGELREYFQAHAEEWRGGVRVTIRQVFTVTPSAAEEAWKAASKRPQEFGVVAKKYSQAPEREQGGLVGTFVESDIPPAFGGVVKTLAVGAVSPVVKTDYGYHVFQVSERRTAPDASYQQVRPVIVGRLTGAGRERAVREWFRKKVKCSVQEEFARLIGWQSQEANEAK